MVSKNESLWLTSGQAGENLAHTQDLPVTFTRVEIGDANGTTPSLDPALTQLINKRQDGELISHELDPYDSSQRIITMAIPPTENFNAIEVLLYAKYGETEFAHTYFTLAAPFAVRTLENGGSQAMLKYTIKVSQETNFTITAVQDLAYATQKDQQQIIDETVAKIRREYPIFRTSENQALLDVDGSAVPSGWGVSGLSAENFSLVETVKGHSLGGSYSNEMLEFFEVAGIKENNYYYNPHKFNIVRIKWTDLSGLAYSFFLNRTVSNIGPYFTFAAFVKMISGNIIVTGINHSEKSWQLVGRNYQTPVDQRTMDSSIKHVSASGEMLIALPAVVSGYVDLTQPHNWWQFVGPLQYKESGV
ncbi:phage tail protein [Thalassomonas actiniarum]|nr:phage tail protein [Thalassomonas actiniarum]